MDYDYYKNLFERFDETELTSWLSDPINTENLYIEYKVAFYSGNDNQQECRKDFAAFANKCGGFIFFGVSDELQVAGIQKDNEIRKHIADKLEPFRSRVSWNVFKVIPLNNGRFVYIVAISGIRSYWEKPLISDGKIFIRDNGCIKLVQDLVELEQYLDFRGFVPKDIQYFEELLVNRTSDLESWGNGIIPMPMYYARIVKGCADFIKKYEDIAINDELKQQTKHLGELFKNWSDSLRGNSLSPLLTQENGTVDNPIDGDSGIKEKLKIFITEFKKLFINE